MKNCIQSSGVNITVTAPAEVASGDGVVIGQLFGVAAGDAASGADLDLVTAGVFDLTKANAADTFTVGAPCYADAAGEMHSHLDADSNSSGESVLGPIGVAVAISGAGEAVVRVRLGYVPALV